MDLSAAAHSHLRKALFEFVTELLPPCAQFESGVFDSEVQLLSSKHVMLEENIRDLYRSVEALWHASYEISLPRGRAPDRRTVGQLRLAESSRQTRQRKSDERAVADRPNLKKRPRISKPRLKSHRSLQRSCHSQRDAGLQFPRPSSIQFSKEARLILHSATTAELTQGQFEFYYQHGFMPVTELQWVEFRLLLDQLGNQLDERGAVLVQPQLNYDPHPLPYTQGFPIKFSQIEGQTRKATIRDKASNYIQFKIGKIESHVCSVAESAQLEDLVTVADFENGQHRGPRLYANNVYKLDAEVMNSFGLQERLNDLAGDELPRTPVFPGINAGYFYFGEPGSSFYLHIEDERLYSVNFVHCGRKSWRFVPSRCKAMLESALHHIWNASHVAPAHCEQFVRHLNVYLPKEAFDLYQIDAYEIEQLPGQVVITAPGVYHQGVNEKWTISEAINYARSWDPVGYAYCTRKCRPRGPLLRMFPQASQTKAVNCYELADIHQTSRAHDLVFSIPNDNNSIKLNFRPEVVFPYVLNVASADILDKIYGIMDHRETPNAASNELHPDYRLLRAGDVSSFKGELAGRIAVLRIWRRIKDLQNQKRRLRSHKKGDKRPEVPMLEIYGIVAAEIAPHDINYAIKRIASSDFKKHGDAYLRLVAELGEPVVALLPYRHKCEELDIERCVSEFRRINIYSCLPVYGLRKFSREKSLQSYSLPYFNCYGLLLEDSVMVTVNMQSCGHTFRVRGSSRQPFANFPGVDAELNHVYKRRRYY